MMSSRRRTGKENTSNDDQAVMLSQISTLESQLDKLQKDNKKLGFQLETALSSNANEKEENKKWKSKCEKIEVELRALTEQREQLMGNLQTQSKESKNLHERNSLLQQQVQNFQKKLEDMEKRQKILENDLIQKQQTDEPKSLVGVGSSRKPQANQSQVESLQTEISKKDKDLEELKKKLNFAMKSLEESQSANTNKDSNKEDVISFRRQAAAATLELENLKSASEKEIAQLKKKLAEKESSLQSINEKKEFGAGKTTKPGTKSQNSSIQDEKLSLQRELESLHEKTFTEISALKKTVQITEQKLSKAEDLLQKEQSKCASFVSENKKLKCELENLQNEFGNMENSVSKLSAENKELTVKINQSDQAKISVEKELRAKIAELSATQNSYQELRDKYTLSMESKDQSATKLEQEKQELAAKLKDEKARLDRKLEEETEANKQRMDLLVSKLAESRQEQKKISEELEKKLKTLEINTQVEVEKITKEKESVELKLREFEANLAKQTETHEMKSEKGKRDMDALQENVKNLNVRLTEYKQKISDLAANLENEKEALLKSTNLNSQLQQNIKTKETELESFILKFKLEEDKNASLKKKLENLEKERVIAEKEIESLKNKTAHLEITSKELQHQNKESISVSKDSQAELKESKKKISELEHQLKMTQGELETVANLLEEKKLEYSKLQINLDESNLQLRNISNAKSEISQQLRDAVNELESFKIDLKLREKQWHESSQKEQQMQESQIRELQEVVRSSYETNRESEEKIQVLEKKMQQLTLSLSESQKSAENSQKLANNLESKYELEIFQIKDDFNELVHREKEKFEEMKKKYDILQGELANEVSRHQNTLSLLEDARASISKERDSKSSTVLESKQLIHEYTMQTQKQNATIEELERLASYSKQLLQEKESKIGKLQFECTRLTQDVEHAGDEIKKSLRTNMELQQKIVSIESIHEADKQKLDLAISQLNANLANSNIEKENMREQLVTVQNSFKNSQTRMTELQLSNEKLRNTVESCQMREKELLSQMQSLKESLNSSESQMQSLKTKKQSDRHTSKLKIEELQTQVKELSTLVSTRNEEWEKLQLRHETAMKENAELLQLTAKQEEGLHAAGFEIAHLTSQMKDIENKYNMCESELLQLKELMKKSSSSQIADVDELKKNLLASTREVQRLQELLLETKEDMKIRLAGMEESKALVVEELTKSNILKKKLESDVRSATERINGTIQELDQVRKESACHRELKTLLEAKVGELESRAEMLETQMKTADKKHHVEVGIMEMTLEELGAQLKEVTAALADREDQCRALAEELREHNKLLEEQTAREKTLQNRLKASELQRESAQSLLDGGSDERRQMEEIVMNLREECEALKNSQSNLKKEQLKYMNEVEINKQEWDTQMIELKAKLQQEMIESKSVEKRHKEDLKHLNIAKQELLQTMQQLQQMQSEKTCLESELEDAIKTANIHATTVGSLQQELEKLSAQHMEKEKNMFAEIKVLKDQLEQAKENADEHAETTAHLLSNEHDVVQNLEEELRNVKFEKELVEKSLSVTEIEIKRKQEEIGEIQKRADKSDSQIFTLTQQLENYKRNYEAVRNQNREIEKHLQEYKDQVATLKMPQHATGEKIDNGEIEALMKKIEQQENEILEFAEKYDAQLSENELLKKQLISLKNALRKNREENK